MIRNNKTSVGNITRHLSITLLFIFSWLLLAAQVSRHPNRQDTLKGSITSERSWWNVLYYDITIEPDLINKTVTGKNRIKFEILERDHPDLMQIDLQQPLKIDSVKIRNVNLQYFQEGNVWWVRMPLFEDKIDFITVYYSGHPKESLNPPYDGGIVWDRDSLERPWISVACQLVGGSVWYPCKDHYSEEPDEGACLSIIIPDSLKVIANGRMRVDQDVGNGRIQYTWTVVNPINNYGIAFYIGNYVSVRRTFAGEKGPLDMNFQVLDYNKAKAIDYMIPEVFKTMQVFEYWFGPYPFYEDGFQMVDAPYIGMEHQSAIAYGNKYRKGRSGLNQLTALDYQTDRLIVHEMAHEWFGNNITMNDMADRWFQEGFAALGEELVIEHLLGREKGREFFITRSRNRIHNEQPLISDYGIFQDAGPDMYFKGWALIHMIREIMDDDQKFREMLRSMNHIFYHQNVASTNIENFITVFSGMDFTCVFDQYLRKAALPVLEYTIKNNVLRYRFQVQGNSFEMSVKIVGDEELWLKINTEWKYIDLNASAMKDSLNIDPNFLIGIRRVNGTP